MSPTSSGVGSGLCLKPHRVFPALTTSQIFTAFDSWRQSQAKVLICFHERPAPQGEIVRGHKRRVKGSSWMETWTFLYHSRSPSPNSPCEHGQEEMGRDILYQCEGLLASCTEARLVGV